MNDPGVATTHINRLSNESLEGSIAEQLFAKIVTDAQDFEVAFALRYRAYFNAGYLKNIDHHSFSDIYDDRPSSKTILIYRGEQAVGSIRVCVLDRAKPDAIDLPASRMFHEEIDNLLTVPPHSTAPRRAVEITRLARDPERLDDRRVLWAMFRMVGYLIIANNADIVFVAVTKNHMPLYRRMGYQIVAAPKAYPGLDVETGLMACFRDDFTSVQRQVAILGSVSRSSLIYADFIGGNKVPVFEDAVTDVSSRLISNRTDARGTETGVRKIA
ncbi:N-acyl amino acid synthase FeeM domain-containing protein [Acidiphilium sp.]|uniref:N-acyl amino acid synthase FeeM domain-containing protein n=1 Tax=Acidiphilium sp. TaxID=527 RepID=UPI003D0818BF